jgi:hypothetical protein
MLRRIILFTCLLLLAWPLAAQAQPSLVIPDTRLTLADPVDQGRIARGEFVVDNRGDAPLEIKSVTPG